MEERTTKERWQRVESLLEAALALPAPERAAFLRRESAGDDELAREVQALLADAGDRGGLPERGAMHLVRPALAAGTQVGAYRVAELVARGSLGEVYRAERADGQFQQRIALKLFRREAIALDRFEDECRRLAQLDHPGIARVHDGGVAPDGRPYLATEWVDGLAITQWCALHQATLRARLDLFLQACDAVAYAHRHLVLHRDLKPANVLVTPEGRVKLRDFGLAHLASGAEFAADTTATDSDALGQLLAELLSGVAPRQRRGDLDAILAQALRREPGARYETATALQADLQRHLQGAAVDARRGERGYALGRFVRRHRWAVAGLALLALALAAALGTTYSQSQRALAEAHRAAAVQRFLEDVFHASDARLTADALKGQVTAREMLDASAPRIAAEFADQPDVRIELLGIYASIYRDLGEEPRYRALHDEQVGLARSLYGDAHPVIVAGLVDDAHYANERHDSAEAMKLLEQARPLLARDGLERTATAARWLLERSEVSLGDGAQQQAGREALEQAAALYAEVAPNDPGYVQALTRQGSAILGRDPAAAERLYRQALEVAARGGRRGDIVLLQGTWPGLVAAREAQGDYDGALAAYEHRADLARRTYGDGQSATWTAAAEYASALHRQGQRAKALGRFEQLMYVIPPDWKADAHGDEAREAYAACLAAEGRPELAIPFLEAALRRDPGTAGAALQQHRDRLVLGDAYDRVGRAEDARAMIKAALDAEVAQAPGGDDAQAARERWGRFLLDQHDLNGAEEQFSGIVLAENGRTQAAFALAHGGLARVALARGDADIAMQQSKLAVERFEHVTGRRDVRAGPYLWLVRSGALRQAGDYKGAREFAQRALDASRQYDDAMSPSIADALVALANAELDLGNAGAARALAEGARAIHAAHALLADADLAPLRHLDERLAK